MPNTPESSIAEKYSNRTAQHTYMVSFDAQSSNTTINFSHSVEAYNASQAVGSHSIGEKSARIICTDRKNVYFCDAKEPNYGYYKVNQTLSGVFLLHFCTRSCGSLARNSRGTSSFYIN